MTCSLDTHFAEVLLEVRKQEDLAHKEEKAIQTSIKEAEDRKKEVEKNYAYSCQDVESFFGEVEQFVTRLQVDLSDAIDRSNEDELQRLQTEERDVTQHIQKCEDSGRTAKSFIQQLFDNEIAVLTKVEQVFTDFNHLESVVETLNSGPTQGFKRSLAVAPDLDTTAAKEKIKEIVENLGSCQSSTPEAQPLSTPEARPSSYNITQAENVTKSETPPTEKNVLPTNEHPLATPSLPRSSTYSSEGEYDIPSDGRKRDQKSRPLSCSVSHPYLVTPTAVISCTEMVEPYSLCLTKNKSIAVSDRKSGTIYLYKKQDGKVLKKIPKKEAGEQLLAYCGEKQRIISVGLSSDKSCQMFRMKTEFGKAVILPEVGQPGGVTVSSDQKPIIVVTDHHKGAISKYTFEGQFVKEIDTTICDVAPKPMGVDYARGDIVLVDQAYHRVVKFSMDGRTKWAEGHRGSGDGCLCYPFDVAVAGDGHIVVTDTDNHRIAIFDDRGAFVLCFGRSGNGAGTFASPRGVAITDEGDIIVADSGNRRLQIFSLKDVLEKNK